MTADAGNSTDRAGDAPPALLDVRGICQRFGGVVALDRVSFAVTPNQIKAVIGPNGAGKTTLFNIVSGMLRPDGGSVHFEGRPLIGRQPYQIGQLGISRTFQNLSLFNSMSVLENVMVGCHCRTQAGFFGAALRLPRQRREESAIRDRARACLESVGLATSEDMSVGALSFGQRRLVELARALATEPRLLLLDEPASGLNTRETDDLATVIRAIRDRGVSILLVEHDMSLVMDISDRILVLDFGRPVAEGTPAEVRANRDVIAIYLGGDFDGAAH